MLATWLSMKCLALSCSPLLSPCLPIRNKQRRNKGRVENHTVILQRKVDPRNRGAQELDCRSEVGRRLGVCCVYYPKGSWDTAETIMYPNIL